VGDFVVLEDRSVLDLPLDLDLRGEELEDETDSLLSKAEDSDDSDSYFFSM